MKKMSSNLNPFLFNFGLKTQFKSLKINDYMRCNSSLKEKVERKEKRKIKCQIKM